MIAFFVHENYNRTTRKPCCRKETARCIAVIFGLNGRSRLSKVIDFGTNR